MTYQLGDPVIAQNLLEAINVVLEICKAELDKAEGAEPKNYALIRDYDAACLALEGMRKVITGQVRIVGRRSGGFTRYVLDEGPSMVMDPKLREIVIRIDGLYESLGGEKRCQEP